MNNPVETLLKSLLKFQQSYWIDPQVDGIEAARSQTQNRWNVETELYPTRFTMTMNTIQSLTVGQTVTVYWEGDAYPNEFPDTRFTHFTGLFLG